MKILCRFTGGGPPKELQANQQVNRVGAFLSKNVEGTIKSHRSGNMYDVWFTLLYEIPPSGDARYQRIDDTLYEMVININITTYQNKVRVNTIECTSTERTLGFDLFEPEKLEDLEAAKRLIMNKVYGRVMKAYKDYDFVGIEPSIDLNLVISRVGKYLTDNIGDVQKSKKSKGAYDIWFSLLYEIPEVQDSRYKRVDDELHEMLICINLSIKNNNVKVTTIEVSANTAERVLGEDMLNAKQLQSTDTAGLMIISQIKKHIYDAYRGYNFAF